jgi:hypothetical protein
VLQLLSLKLSVPDRPLCVVTGALLSYSLPLAMLQMHREKVSVLHLLGGCLF